MRMFSWVCLRICVDDASLPGTLGRRAGLWKVEAGTKERWNQEIRNIRCQRSVFLSQ